MLHRYYFVSTILSKCKSKLLQLSGIGKISFLRNWICKPKCNVRIQIELFGFCSTLSNLVEQLGYIHPFSKTVFGAACTHMILSVRKWDEVQDSLLYNFFNQLRSKIRHTDYHNLLTDFTLAPGSDLVMCCLTIQKPCVRIATWG